MTRCFLCNKPIRSTSYQVDTGEDQAPLVGPDCYRKVIAAGLDGLLANEPNAFGVRLFVLTNERKRYFESKGIPILSRC